MYPVTNTVTVVSCYSEHNITASHAFTHIDVTKDNTKVTGRKNGIESNSEFKKSSCFIERNAETAVTLFVQNLQPLWSAMMCPSTIGSNWEKGNYRYLMILSIMCVMHKVYNLRLYVYTERD